MIVVVEFSVFLITCLGIIVLTFMEKYKKRGYDLHEFIVSDDLDCHLLAGPGSVPGSDHIAEYTLASVAIHIIAFVQCLPDVHP